MKTIDWSIIGIYVLCLLYMGWRLGKGQKNLNDYFLGSRDLSWWSVGVSTMATQLGAISFISAPAFVGLRPGGGLIWLGYEFAVPFAMIILIWKVIPLFHESGVISIYEFLEKRFDRKSRIFVSIVFLISRGLATGVTIYAAAIVVSVVMKIPLTATILIIGIVAVIYDYMGGIKAVVYSDVIQMTIILAGLAACTAFGLYYTGGLSPVLNTISPERFTAVDFGNTGLGKGGDFGFLPLLFGGFFLYTSYYGFDQSQVQRELSARTLNDSRKSLLFNAFARYPIVLLYCMLGLIIGTFAVSNADFMKMIPSGRVDYMIPVFVVHYLPAGLTGLIVTAIIAASMSTLDSALNSLSASTIEDILKPGLLKNMNDEDLLKKSKLVTLFWGIFCTGFAFLAGNISRTVIESINMIGSIFYGPIAGVFFLGIFFRKAVSRDAIIGGSAGVAVNLALAAGIYPVSWLWWNVTGFLSSLLIGNISSFTKKRVAIIPEKINTGHKQTVLWFAVYIGLILFGAGIILLSVHLRWILSIFV